MTLEAMAAAGAFGKNDVMFALATVLPSIDGLPSFAVPKNAVHEYFVLVYAVPGIPSSEFLIRVQLMSACGRGNVSVHLAATGRQTEHGQFVKVPEYGALRFYMKIDADSVELGGDVFVVVSLIRCGERDRLTSRVDLLRRNEREVVAHAATRPFTVVEERAPGVDSTGRGSSE
jgi:hypothetical protein